MNGAVVIYILITFVLVCSPPHPSQEEVGEEGSVRIPLEF